MSDSWRLRKGRDDGCLDFSGGRLDCETMVATRWGDHTDSSATMEGNSIQGSSQVKPHRIGLDFIPFTLLTTTRWSLVPIDHCGRWNRRWVRSVYQPIRASMMLFCAKVETEEKGKRREGG